MRRFTILPPLRREDRGGSHSPPYAIFWRLYGAVRYRVAFF
jgi:hypothetical protein